MHRSLDYTDTRSGLTLVEVTVVLAIFSILTLVVWHLISGSGKAVRAGFAASEVDTAMRRVMQRMQEDLRSTGSAADGTNYVTSHPIDQTTSSESITFSKRIDVTETSADWTAPITYSLQASEGEDPSNGLDDDQDGIVDERTIVRDDGAEALILADNVTSAQFTRSPGEFKVDITFTLARFSVDEDALNSRSATATVAFRNKIND